MATFVQFPSAVRAATGVVADVRATAITIVTTIITTRSRGGCG